MLSSCPNSVFRLLVLALSSVVSLVWAGLPGNDTRIGDEITHPVSGATLTVVELLDLSTLPVPVVVAEDADGEEYVVLGEPDSVPVTFEDPNPDSTATFTITDLVINDDTGLVEQFILDDGDTAPLDVALVPDDVTWATPGSGGGAGGQIPVTIPTGNENVVANKRNGHGGGNGSDGGGIRICFFGCFTIGYNPTKGGDGQRGPTIDEYVSGDPISSITDDLPGITVSSIGGDGGDGGDGYGVNIKGARGGSGGPGGNVFLETFVDITTSGEGGHGIFAQSRSGKAGDGGSGFLWSSGGEGGPPGHGGTVTVINHGNIATLGDGAIGILAQSSGGAAGDGGDSWGLVGAGGSSLSGGHGGTVSVTHNGVIQTEGFASHGIVAQSIGGTGGNGGNAGGVVSFGGGGSAGGDAGEVGVNLGVDAGIHTAGDQAHGLLAQSIGGGGGSGGTGGGVAAFGGTGEAGGDGSKVRVINAAGGQITTTGNDSDGIVAQSIGGGGGDGGAGGGVVALGGSGSAAGAGGFVEVLSGADVSTSGDGSRGLFAQSVGGGGGSARGSGGAVALGGSGGSGGDGGNVSVGNEGRIETAGEGGGAIVAQSIGGGGGAGGSGSGLAGLGGSGDSGGAGGDVTLINSGGLLTLGDLSRGLFAQSVGGGGGFGGSGSGLAGIGGAGSATSDGGDVTIDNSGAIRTGGERGHGVQAQSIGGGGGDGGTSSGVLFTLGGSGGGGGDAGEVSVTHGNEIVTEGEGARGIFAQSVGGGGGNGGASYSGSAFGGIAIGGGGGAGGEGGDTVVNFVTVSRQVDGEFQDVSAHVETHGDNAEGVLSQSIGGGGGNGGQAVQITGGAFGAVSAAVGGSGGDGGDGGQAGLTGDASVLTTGLNADGVVVQSVGGGGGSGGGAISVAAAAGPAAGSFSFGMGGSGGGGGDGGEVHADAAGAIHTEGDLSDGFLAQSVGGGGGKGGWVVNASVAAGQGGSVAVGIGLGGSGGDGGSGGQVDARYAGNVSTAGDNASAWTAQSVGGGGGQGGFNVSGVAAMSGGSSGSVAFGLGGSGGGGGDADTVIARLIGDLLTKGDMSTGVVAQSTGGGGGSGGFNVSGGISAGNASGALAVGFGGSGGDGGDGAEVDLIYSGTAGTLGDDATAVIAQSVGGGGGQGAMNVSGGISASSGSGGALAFGMGGSGGGGGHAGTVTSDVGGDIRTEGDRSSGVITQSVGGGGGNGGINVASAVALSSQGGGSLAFGIGGSGGDGGDGRDVLSTILADVLTQGQGATGVLTQSTGGGGGNGALNVSASVTMAGSAGGGLSVGIGGFGGGGGDAGSATLDFEGAAHTRGDDADAVVVQSTGGGGGNGGINVSGGISLTSGSGGAAALGLGGFGGEGGNAGEVSLHRVGDTTTSGANADAITVQSVGGGGGNGGLNVSGTLTFAQGGGAAGLALGVGGFGGSGGDAGNVVANIIGNVLATGSDEARFEYDEDGELSHWLDRGSHGVMAQSIGGSGGNGGINVSGGIQRGTTSGSMNLGVGGFGGGGGDAGSVNLDLAGDVVATGDYRNAVTAQSIGGGGGNGAMNVSGGITGNGQVTAGIGGFGGDGGKAEGVQANVEGDLYATGLAARGLLVQSIGGGGGNGGVNISGGLNTTTTGATPSLVFGMGGAGGTGNEAGDVAANQQGSIVVQGRDSTAVLVQSIGGGGGSGATNYTGLKGAGRGIAAAFGIGGEGGVGSDAGQVVLHSDGDILADGRLYGENGEPLESEAESEAESEDYSHRATGILAQSIGGGGGHGGANWQGVVASRGSVFAAGLGGTGGDGGEAGAVTVIRGANQAATLETFGDQSTGLIAQSIGGGGGNAGTNFVFSANTQGGTGGNRSYEANIVIGGAGGEPGDGNATLVDHRGDLVTHGRQSIGLLAQSIGGGGGNAALSLGVGLNNKASGVNLSIGGAPGDGGDGGTVDVFHEGAIATEGHDSTAIIAQSIGGGGGNAALTKAFSKGASNKLDLGLGRVGGTGGTGGDVTVETSGVVATEGDRSVGLFAQSVGNGGGRSTAHSIGFKASGSQGTGGDPVAQASIGLSLGLEGGVGGFGGAVLVDTDSMIVTEGAQSHAVHAQSIGGGGGVGGAATDLVLSETAAARVALGGAGGEGGEGGRVAVSSTDLLTTHGDGAHGLYAQSIGGGGGTGGMAGVLTLQTGSSANLGDNTGTLTVGGEGGTGGVGGETVITNQGTILTLGEASHAIRAQSVGGGGGDGGLILNGTLSTAGNKTSLSLALGGDGGEGGEGGRVTVENQGLLFTENDDSIGIFAQSVGGGGGDAGLVADLDFAKLNQQAASAQLAVNLGGKGGLGGSGGTVNVINAADAMIETQGSKAYGIFAQSIGGGGGNGGSVVSANFGQSGEESQASINLGLNIGGDGGTGGVGGHVDIDNLGLVLTHGDQAHGVYAQSIGGGGGNGGIALAADVLLNAGSGSPLTAVLGGSGGKGGDGGAVTVSNHGQIVTHGRDAHGILAQSIGGGGGNGNVGLAASNSLSGMAIANGFSALLGGEGGEGGSGGEVTLDHVGDITVTGEGSRAYKLESINGGGGGLIMDFDGITSVPGGEGLPAIPGLPDPGGLGASVDPVLTLRAGGENQVRMAAGSVSSTTRGDFVTLGERGTALDMQSVGGGGGSLLLNLDLAEYQGGGVLALDARLGGKDGEDNHGNDIVSAHTGSLFSMGHRAAGVSLRSVGGGGGLGVVDTSGDRRGIDTANVVLGADGTGDHHAGDVTHRQSGDVVSLGDHSIGLLAQSIGAGGGEWQLSGLDAFAAIIGGEHGASGDGGAIDLSYSGTLQTAGVRSHGVFLQSIGGGGGAIFSDAAGTPDIRLSTDNRGDGGEIRLAFEGDIIVTGQESHGLFAQSIGGGGGYVDGVGALVAGGQGQGAAVNIDLQGSVFAGTASAVFLHSEGASGAGDISLALAEDQVIIGGIGSPALQFAGGATNTFSNHGVLFAVGDVNGTAMAATGGDDRVDNFGAILGSVILGDGDNRFVNHAGAQLLSGSVVDLGDASARVTNSGLLAPGGAGLAMHTRVNGGYQQEAEGRAIMELDFARDTTDAVHATGGVELAGELDIDLLNPGLIKAGAHGYTLFNAEQGFTDAGFQWHTEPSAVIRYHLERPSDEELQLVYDADFTAHGQIGGNPGGVGGYLNRVQTAGSSPQLAELVEVMIHTPELPAYRATLNALSATPYATQQANAVRMAQRFGRSLMSCSSNDTLHRHERQGSCLWFRVGRPSTRLDAHDDSPAMSSSGTSTAVGGQKTMGNLTLGLAVSQDDHKTNGFGHTWRGDGDTTQFGGVVKYQWDETLLTSSLVLGRSDMHMERSIDLTGPMVAAGARKLDFAAATLGLSRRFDQPWLTLKPLLEVGALRVRSDDDSERGAGALGLEFEGESETHLWLRPGLEVSHAFLFDSGASIYPYARASLVHYPDSDESTVRATLSGAPDPLAGMQASSELGQNQRLFEAGIDFTTEDGFSLKLYMERTVADHFEADQVNMKVAFPF